MTKESLSKDSDSTAITKPIDVVKVLPKVFFPEIKPHNIIVNTANSPEIEANVYPINRAAMERQSKEIHGNSKINGCCAFSVFITFVNPTRNNKENGIANNPNSI